MNEAQEHYINKIIECQKEVDDFMEEFQNETSATDGNKALDLVGNPDDTSNDYV